MKLSGKYSKDRMMPSTVEPPELKELRLLIPTKPPSLARTFPARAGPLISRPPETRLSCPFSMRVASNASSVTDDVDEDDDPRCPRPKNMFRDAKKEVMADDSLITSKAAEMGATKGPEVNARRVICGMYVSRNMAVVTPTPRMRVGMRRERRGAHSVRWERR